MLNPQLDRRGELIHLLTTEGLPRRHVERLLDAAAGFAQEDGAVANASAATSATTSGTFAASSAAPLDLPLYLGVPADDADLRRAYASAGQRLGLRPIPLDDGLPAGNLPAPAAGLPPGILVLRHAASGAAVSAAAAAPSGLRILNAGDGIHADPLPALARVAAMLRAKQDLTNLAVALVGDIRHSAVARSLIHAFTTLGVPEVRAAAPRTLLPDGLPQLGVRACATLQECLADADVVIVLPLHIESLSGALLPSAREYTAVYGLTSARLAAAKPDALLLPAGRLTPGIEVDGDLAAGLTAVDAQLADTEGRLRLAALSVLGATP